MNHAPMTVAALVGSLRRSSFNRIVSEAAGQLLPAGVELEPIDLQSVPFYNGDVEQAGDPDSVAELKRAVEASDAVIVFTPEYNRSIPAVTKNAIDWLSRMPREGPLSRATVGVVAATPGRHDASGVRAHLAQVLAITTDRFYEATFGIASIGQKVEDGVLTDAETRAELEAWLAGFVDWVRSP